MALEATAVGAGEVADAVENEARDLGAADEAGPLRCGVASPGMGGGDETSRVRLDLVQEHLLGEIRALHAKVDGLALDLRERETKPGRDSCRCAQCGCTGQRPGRAGTSAAQVPHRRAYSLKEAAVLLNVSLTKVKDLVRDREIAIVTVGSRRRILNAEIDRYLLSDKGKRRR